MACAHSSFLKRGNGQRCQSWFLPTTPHSHTLDKNTFTFSLFLLPLWTFFCVFFYYKAFISALEGTKQNRVMGHLSSFKREPNTAEQWKIEGCREEGWVSLFPIIFSSSKEVHYSTFFPPLLCFLKLSSFKHIFPLVTHNTKVEGRERNYY